jgi:hypothetical protein
MVKLKINKMKKQIALLSIVAAALMVTPALSRAQDKPAATEPAAPAPTKNHGVPFHGKVVSVDAAASTLVVGKHTLSITPDTKILKADKAATLADVTAGEIVSGSYKKVGDNLQVTKLTIGSKSKTSKTE